MRSSTVAYGFRGDLCPLASVHLSVPAEPDLNREQPTKGAAAATTMLPRRLSHCSSDADELTRLHLIDRRTS